MKRFYRFIANARELKNLHDEAALHDQLEVGVSKGKILYAWDEDRHNLRSITPEEAAERLNLAPHQIDLIVETLGDVVFDTPEEVKPEDQWDDLDEVFKGPEAEVIEEAPYEEVSQTTVEDENLNAPEHAPALEIEPEPDRELEGTEDPVQNTEEQRATQIVINTEDLELIARAIDNLAQAIKLLAHK